MNFKRNSQCALIYVAVERGKRGKKEGKKHCQWFFKLDYGIVCFAVYLWGLICMPKVASQLLLLLQLSLLLLLLLLFFNMCLCD